MHRAVCGMEFINVGIKLVRMNKTVQRCGLHAVFDGAHFTAADTGRLALCRFGIVVFCLKLCLFLLMRAKQRITHLPLHFLLRGWHPFGTVI